MEKTMSVEEKIKRAEEIYNRRQGNSKRQIATVNLNNNKKNFKLLKKMLIQILVSLLIYLAIATIQNSNYVFSENFINKVNEILSYDINFSVIYNNIKQTIKKNNQLENNNEAIGGAIENIIEDSNTIENSINKNELEGINEISNEGEIKRELSQEEIDIENIKNTTTFIKPINGTISSKYGYREPTTSTVPKNHTGIDIAANLGTKIVAATSGEVVLASSEGDYGNHLKIQIGEVSIIYAHCNKLYVGQGEKIIQGQEIAEVGSTGNSTGPHLHFEVRISERTVDPEKILEF